MIKNRKKGFSLIEAMLSLVILSVVLVMTASLITKKIDFKSHEGIIYTYQNSDATESCYVLNKDATAYVETKDCSEYVFEVPKGVAKVNLTLVAGGGGGAGGYTPETIKGSSAVPVNFYTLIQKNNPSDQTPVIATVLPEYLAGLKELKIEYMTGKGEETDSSNLSSCETTVVCSDSGKQSSAAIIGLEVPESYLKEIRKVDKIEKSEYAGKKKLVGNISGSFSSGTSLIMPFNTNADGSSPLQTISCNIPNAPSSDEPSCMAGGNKIASKLGINIFKGANGQPSMDYTAERVYLNTILQGGVGGQISRMLHDSSGVAYGSGANGVRRKLYCADYNISATACDSDYGLMEDLNSTKAAGKGYIQVSYNADKISNIIPSGGAGGTVLRTLDFPVIAGEKYIIRVGKGGKGGMGSITEGAGVSKSTITGTEDAKGGVTTAIYKLDGTTETLVYLVNGGMQGRMTNSPSYNVPKVYSSSDTYINLLKLDPKVNKEAAASGIYTGESVIDPVSGSSKMLAYPFMAKEPFIRLNSPKHEVAFAGGAVMRAFSAFPKIYTGSGASLEEDSTNKLEGVNMSFKDPSNNTITKKVYDGFFPRRIINNQYAYIGGLGGFSGIGGKAGCGGFFNGNSDGRSVEYTDGEGNLVPGEILTDFFKTQVINKIIANDTLYRVSDYYEGCNNSADGQTVKFVMPDYKKHLLGSAGAGGGAGGYSIETGVGNGGDGQNGYVMIEWRK